MKIINNRYKIKNLIFSNPYYESYKAIDLWDNDKTCFLKLYNYDIKNELIEYFINDFNLLVNIEHENILKTNRFGIVKNIDTKNVNMLLYYTINEYMDYPNLEEINDELELEDKFKILIQIILALDFLHFRGITYKLLNPTQIFVYEKNKVKIQSLSTIVEKAYNYRYTDFERKFLSSEVIISNSQEDKSIDYYSLGVLIEYLFLDDESLDEKERKLLLNISKNLIKRNYENADINLIEILDKIIIKFEIDCKYDLFKHRDKLFFNSNIAGRKKEVAQMMRIDEDIYNRTNSFKGILVSGDLGTGKSRLLGEFSYKLSMEGRNVYSISIKDHESNDLLDISNLLKQSIKDTSSNLIDKYREELSKILPELSLYKEESSELKFSLKAEKYRIFNRILNYFKELSKDRIIYITIDDIQNCNQIFSQLLDYLLNNMDSPNIFFIFSYNHKLNKDYPMAKIIKSWLSDSSLIDMKLLTLDLQETGEVVQNILGMGIAPINFAITLFKETLGNPRKIESLIKYLYNIGQLYMNKEGRWHITADEYSELYIPTSTNESILKQLNRIKKDHYEIFKLLSIFDDFSHKNILLEILNVGAEELELELNKLIRLKLIDEKLVDWGYSYSINNIEIKKIIYFELTKDEKRNLHKKVVEVILKFKDKNLETFFEELVYHLIKSEQSNKAIEIILKKIENLDNIYNVEGIYLLEKAHKIAKDEDNIKKLQILEKLTNIYFTIGKFEELEVYLIEYEDLSNRLKEFKHLIKAKTIFANIYYIKKQLDLYLEQIREIEEIADENDIIEGKIIELSFKARLSIRKGQVDKAQKQLIQAMELSKKYKIDNYKAVIYNRLATTRFLLGDIKNAIMYYEKSIDLYKEEGNIIDATGSINKIGSIYMRYYGDTEKAMEYYEKGLDIANKYNIKAIETFFLHNISSVYLIDYEYDKALQHALQAKKNAIDLQDINSMFISHIDLGKIYLFTGKYDKAYENYKYVKEIFQSKKITNLQSLLNYHDFMAEFYICLGKFTKARENCIIINDIHGKTNEKEYLKAEFRLILLNYLENKCFDKDEINNLINRYKETLFFQDSREAYLILSGICIFEGDLDYAFEILEEDKKLKKLVKKDYLNKLRDIITCCINPSAEKLNNLLFRGKELHETNRLPMESLTNLMIGLKFCHEKNFRDSIKYFIESLDIIYRDMLKIPDLDLRLSFIKSRETDYIKISLVRAIKRTYGKTLDYTNLKNIDKNKLNNYFDITPIVDVLGNEEFTKLTQLDSYGDGLNIKSVDQLLSKLTKDYKHNIDLILKYISKESFASRGYLLKSDRHTQRYNIVASIDGRSDYKINENILKLANRFEQGLLINNDILAKENLEHKEFLSDNIRGIICVPIFTDMEDTWYLEDGRLQSEKDNIGYIYLETDRVFNRFNKEKLHIIYKLIYLIYINLENNRLMLEATRDKLTGTYTRKYFENAFEELLCDSKEKGGSFSVLMLDIDRFKNVNDIYGHRKGDEVLQEIGKTLKALIRSTDIVARYGGEEFTILLKNVEEKESKIIAEKIRKAICYLKIKGIDTPITISIGVSIFPLHSQFREELMEKSDQALYTAKESGRNKVCFWDYSMVDSFNRADKLAGILTGNTESDNRNILAVIDIIELIKENKNLKYKSFKFLGNLIDALEADHASLIILEEENSIYYSRARFNEGWVNRPVLNMKIIDRVKENRKGEFLIDWENASDINSLPGISNWESIIVLPLIKEEKLKGIIYLSSSLKIKEFDFNSYNLSKCIANIFSAIL